MGHVKKKVLREGGREPTSRCMQDWTRIPIVLRVFPESSQLLWSLSLVVGGSASPQTSATLRPDPQLVAQVILIFLVGFTGVSVRPLFFLRHLPEDDIILVTSDKSSTSS